MWLGTPPQPLHNPFSPPGSAVMASQRSTTVIIILRATVSAFGPSYYWDDYESDSYASQLPRLLNISGSFRWSVLLPFQSILTFLLTSLLRCCAAYSFNWGHNIWTNKGSISESGRRWVPACKFLVEIIQSWQFYWYANSCCLHHTVTISFFFLLLFLVIRLEEPREHLHTLNALCVFPVSQMIMKQNETKI